jgi:hypothetical protein
LSKELIRIGLEKLASTPKKAQRREVAGVFIPISHKGLSGPLTGQEWRIHIILPFMLASDTALSRNRCFHFVLLRLRASCNEKRRDN